MKNFIFYGALFLLGLTGNAFGQHCASDTRYSEVAYFDSTEISIAANVPFGTATDHVGNAYVLGMDLYYPKLTIDPSPKRPFLLLFHGGGFSSGDKQSGDIRDLAVHMARRGFVCASANYRLGYNFTEYGQFKARYRAIQDGHAAMRYITQNANTLRIDTSWMFVGGQSAGSLLALGMVYADPSELDSVSLRYNATPIGVELGNLYTSGNSLTNTYLIKAVFNNWGGIPENEVKIQEMLPTVAFHGGLDTTVRIGADTSFLHYTLDGSLALHQKLVANSVCSEITVDPLGGHGIFRNSSSEFRAGRASCFFKSLFCSSCSNFYATDSVPSQCSLPVSTLENFSAGEVKVVPNPVQDHFRIEGVKGKMGISIYNGIGKCVFSQDPFQVGNEPSVLRSGLYFLNLWEHGSNKKFSVRMLIK